MEAMRRAFKNCIADRVGQFAGGGIPAAYLPRLLLSHVHELDQRTPAGPAKADGVLSPSGNTYRAVIAAYL